jgi:class 3 adenylate cyclase
MAARLFDCDYAEISFLNHSTCFNVASHYSCSSEAKALLAKIKPPVSRCDNGDPWLCTANRGPAICNYVVYTKQTFTVRDVWADESFAWARAAKACRFYSGSPIVVRGMAIAILCIYDFRRAHPEFTDAHQIQQEQLAQLAAQQLENWAVAREARSPVSEVTDSDELTTKSLPPEYLAAVVCTNVQCTASLPEADSGALQDALALHNGILRECIGHHHGYEIANETGSFQIVFHDCSDAVSFALQAQERLHNAAWSDDILKLPDACDDGEGLRGLRVRIAVHYGPVTCQTNDTTERIEYTGTTVNIAKSLEQLAYGGQILTTLDVWNLASTPSESAQVMDLGRHVLIKGQNSKDGIIEKDVVQLVPLSLAFDFFSRRTLSDDHGEMKIKTITGRQFPPVMSIKRLSASFHEAPYDGNQVTIMFLDTDDVELFCNNIETVLRALAKQIGALLSSQGNGYQCKNFMLAFANVSHAVSFGLLVQEHLHANRIAGAQLGGLIKIGIHSGTFNTMGPHQTTGRADYYGTLVNRTTRIADAAKAGEVVIGMIDDEIPQLSPELDSTFIGSRRLEGFDEEIDIHVCQWDAASM